MANPYIGQISIFGFPFAPVSWAYCDGTNVPINQYSSLYSLIGTAFGGNGTSQFGLPNMGGSSVCGTGQGPGLSNRSLGQSFGTATVTLDGNSMPSHTHTPNAVAPSRALPRTAVPTPLSGLTTGDGITPYTDGGANVAMASGAVSPNGSGAAHNNMQPYIGMNYCIALLGQYPYFP